MIAPEAGLSISRQCTLLGIARSSFYYRPRPESAEELELLKRLDRIFTDCPVYGSRRLQVALLREGISMGRRRVRRLMRKLGLWAVRPKRNTSKRHPGHKVYPYLLRGKSRFRSARCHRQPLPQAPEQSHSPSLVNLGAWAASGCVTMRCGAPSSGARQSDVKRRAAVPVRASARIGATFPQCQAVRIVIWHPFKPAPHPQHHRRLALSDDLAHDQNPAAVVARRVASSATVRPENPPADRPILVVVDCRPAGHWG